MAHVMKAENKLANRWMQKASESIKASGHKGIFKAAAKRHGMSTSAFARRRARAWQDGQTRQTCRGFCKAKH